MTSLLEAPARTSRQRPVELWDMTATERAEAMLAGRLSWDQCWEWARHRPGEVPLLNGEFWFIAIKTPEACE
ncbi:hypothetical protein [Conexibacter sp. DBS9H8]|uniref:hypothetical protein n=1 Tax=Conexibacter sp. DBS9H8 TaxID=2937801 RepID=UPI00200F41F7|nr:hypothetical protein [Conexibacter sp. DBS9H8]